MADAVLNALQRKLEMYEAAEMPDQVKAVRARITKYEKGPAKVSTGILTDTPANLAAAVPASKMTVRKTVKKATKAQARKK